jgi:hypothetical protein
VADASRLVPPHPPRGLVVGASVWIATSWFFLMGSAPPLQPTSLSYTPAIRMMVQSMLMLTIVAWPLVRLSCAPRPRPVLSALLDTIALLVLWQIVLWPMRLVTTWPVARMLLVNGEAVASTMFVGAIIAWSGATQRGRTGAMIALLAWSVAVPVLARELDIRADMLQGPFVRAWFEGGRGPGPVTPGAWWSAAATGGLGLLVWGIAATRRTPSAGEACVTSVS